MLTIKTWLLQPPAAQNFHDFETLGLEDMFSAPAVAILEWSERFPLPSPWPQLRVRLEHLGGDSRRITVL